MTPSELRRLMSAVGGLSADEIEKVKQALSAREGQVVRDTVECERLAKVTACPHCGSLRFAKDGHANGRQRFRCKEQECGRTFNALTGTPLARLHMAEKHLENAMLMADGHSIRTVAARLGVSVPTAFKWRHRFLQYPISVQPASLTGVVEADETFFLESFKGQRQNLPRPAKKRGAPAQIPGLGPEQIPVLVARAREAGFTMTVRIKSRAAKHIAPELANKMAQDAVLVSDSAKAYRKVAKTLGVELIQVPRNVRHKTRGAVHINNTNSYIKGLQGWMKRFRGVATKNLPNYLAWHRILEREGRGLTAKKFLAASLG